jgi:hypothetical protein
LFCSENRDPLIPTRRIPFDEVAELDIMKTSIVASLISVSAFTINGAHAWGVLGHQAVGLLAQNFLLPATIKKVQAILNDTSSSYMGNVATWADQFRSEPGQGWSAQLHYINAEDGPPPDSCVIHEMDCPAGGCITSALANYVRVLFPTSLLDTDRNVLDYSTPG